MKDKIFNVPISSLTACVLIIIFLLFQINILKSYPCEKDMVSSLISNFIHIDFLHLISNLYAIFILSKVEESIGVKKFFTIVCLVLVINTIFETIFYKLFNIQCSIGYSAIIYGIFSWEYVTTNKINPYIISSIFFDLILNRKNIGIINHLIGLISGVYVSLFIK
jgi:rhomboid protease GluP